METPNQEFETPTEFFAWDIEDSHQESPLPELLPATHSSTPVSTNQWNPRLVLDLALEIDALPDILARYSLTRDELDHLATFPAFRRELAQTIRDVRENGVSFAQKARVQAESYLPVLDEIVHNAETPQSVRLAAIRDAVRWGNLEPKDAKDGGNNQNNVINVQINF